LNRGQVVAIVAWGSIVERFALAVLVPNTLRPPASVARRSGQWSRGVGGAQVRPMVQGKGNFRRPFDPQFKTALAPADADETSRNGPITHDALATAFIDW